MAKTTEDILSRMEQDWGGNGLDVGGRENPYEATSDGKPFDGLQVQKFIKTQLEQKFGGLYFDGSTSTMYCFDSKEIEEQWEDEGRDPESQLIRQKVRFDFSSKVYNFKVVNQQGSTSIYFTQQQEHCNVSIGFISQSRSLTETEWVDTGEDASVEVYCDRGNTGVWEKIAEQPRLEAGHIYTIDVKDHLSLGTNRLRFVVTGAETGQHDNMVFSVTLTSMYLEASNPSWATPFFEGSQFSLGGFHIGGALNKTLKVKVTKDQSYSKLYTKSLGVQTWTDNDYFFEDMEFPDEGTGIYATETWLETDEGLESDHVLFNIMCVAEDDADTAQLVCCNDIPAKLDNYSANRLFRYAIYNKGIATGSPDLLLKVVIRQSPTVLVDAPIVDVSVETIHDYVYSPEIESEEETMSMSCEITYGNTQQCIYVLDNSASYPPTSDAIFYLNPSLRNNTDQNKTLIVNDVAGGGTISAQWTAMSFSGSGDGWSADKTGRKCLLIPAGSRGNISYKPMQNLGTNGAKTVEFILMVDNVGDGSEPVVTICDNPSSVSFKGIKLTPSKVIAHSLLLFTNDAYQSYSFGESKLLDVIVTMTKGYKTNYGNLCTIYVNGVKKCEFEYTDSDTWTNDGNIILGCDNSDLYLYGMRVYNRAFGHADAWRNYVASLPTQGEKAVAYELGREIVDDSWNIDYDAVRQVANCMVVEIEEGGVLPHYGVDKKYSTHANVEFFYHGHPEKDCRIEGVETSGQGTTSMNYYRWNLRFRMDKSNSTKKCPVRYYNPSYDPSSADPSAHEYWLAAVQSSTVRFDGNGVHTPITRITAKTNYASSMQSHKMGATAAFNDLHDEICGPNEAGGRTAVFQHPFYGFQKTRIPGTSNYAYTFIGLYTVGPDKGDKPTFGYGQQFSNTEMSLEGVDHTQALAKFAYPWNEHVKYVASEESLCIEKGDGTFDKGFECSVCHGLGTDKSTDEAAINSAFLTQFKPGYELTYNNSTFILNTDKTLAQINADPTWREKVTADHRPYTDLEFYTEDVYDLYYYDITEGVYKASGVNLLEQYIERGGSEDDIEGKTAAQILEIFKESRRSNFKSNVWTYFDQDDTMFAFVYCLMVGASDNFAKNMYPYIFGEKWRWRQDDLDTIFDIDNQGHSGKPFSIEYQDFTDESFVSKVYKGENSRFWTLIFECFSTGSSSWRVMGKRILAAMYSLSTTGTTSYDKIYGFFTKYFWNNAQYYFAKTAYNIDAEYKYEEAWPPYNRGSYVVDTHPLSQSLGDALESEQEWIGKRIVYCMSQFAYGPFEQYTDTCLGTITVRPLRAMNWTVKPAIDLYPAGLFGQSGRVAAQARVKAGEAFTITGIGGENTNVYIPAADWIEDLGDLSKLQIDGSSITLGGKRLKKIKIGDAVASGVTANFTTLTLGDSPCLLEIDARNNTALAGTINMTNCPRLRKAMLAGTSVTGINLPDGTKINTLSVPSTLLAISLLNARNLTTAGFIFTSLVNLTTMRMENCVAMDPFSVLWGIYNQDDQSLRYIRLIGINSTSATLGTDGASIIRMLSNIASNKDKDGATHQYNGIDVGGSPTSGSPVLQGTLSVPHAYQSDVELVGQTFTGLALTVTGGYYIDFLDDAFKALLVASSYSSDHIGMLQSEIESIITLGTILQEAGDVHNLGDLNKLLYLELPTCTSHEDSQFYGCVGLTHIKFPALLPKVGGNTFQDIEALESLDFSLCADMTVIESDAFVDCSFTEDAVIDLSGCTTLEEIEEGAFSGCDYEGEIDMSSLEALTSADLSGLGSPEIIAIDNLTLTSLTF